MSDTSVTHVGVYVCHCGSNIAATIDVIDVVNYAYSLPGVSLARDCLHLCSSAGQDSLKQDIAQGRVNRVVVAACSPRIHEDTFRAALASAGLNQYLLAVANIREQCAWITKDRESGTAKAKRLVRAAVGRVALQEELEARRAPVLPVALVVGGGIAGIQAALTIANAGYQVYLVERQSAIGGRMAQLDKTFPTLDCSSCILTPKMVEVARHPNITLLTNSQVTAVSGYVGNFQVSVTEKPRFIDARKCTACGECVSVCPVTLPHEFDQRLSQRRAVYRLYPEAVPAAFAISKGDGGCIECGECARVCSAGAVDVAMEPQSHEFSVGTIVLATGHEFFNPLETPQYLYGSHPNVLDSMEFERMCNSGGPTGGEIITAEGRLPESIVFIHCVGSRDPNGHAYCSRLCCMHAMKQARLARERTGAEVHELCVDIRAAGKGYEEFFDRVQAEGVNFARGRAVEVIPAGGRLTVVYRGGAGQPGEPGRLVADLVVLVTGLEPHEDAGEIARIFHITRDKDGFFLEAHPKLRPFNTNTDGIFLAGTCQAPRDIPDTVAHASAAAGEALSLMGRGSVMIEPVVAEIDAELCSGCRICRSLCPYSAIVYRAEQRTCEINAASCKGCGICAAACPAGGIRARQYEQRQIFAEIRGLLAPLPVRSGPFEPQIVAFLCNWCSYQGADTAGGARLRHPLNVDIIRVNCSGRVEADFILNAFAEGADGVIVAGCHPGDCHYTSGNYTTMRRATLIRRLLSDLGIEQERFRLEWLSAAEGTRWARVVWEMTEQVRRLGPLAWDNALPASRLPT